MALKTNGHTWTKSGFTGDFDQMLTGLRDALGFLETRVGNLTNDLQVASEISQQITTVLELGQLLPQIVEKTNASFNLYHSQVYLLDESGENLNLAASAGEVGRTLLAKGHKIPLAREDSLVARCGRTRVGIIVNDVKQEAGYFANPLLPNTRAEMTVPMVVGGELIGVLDMQSEHVDNFSEDDLWVKTTLAGQIAVAVQNARTFAEAQERASETDMLYEMTSRLAQANTRAEVLASVSAYPQMQGATSMSLLYIDTAEDETPLWAELAAELQLTGGSGTPVGSRYYLPDLPFAKLWMSNPDSPVLIDDVMTNDLVDPVTKNIYQMTDTHGSVIIPLTVSGRWVGLIVISWRESQTFTELDRRIYGTISLQTASVVNSTRLFEQTQKSARELETVAKVSAAATSILDMDTMLQSVSDLTRESFELYHAHVYLLDEARENLVLTAGAGETGRTMKAQGHSIPLNRQHSLVARAARTAQGVIVNDITQEPDFLANELLPLTKAEMAVPMIVGGEVLGVLDMQSEQAGRFGTNDANVQTTLAGQIAIAVQNARSYAVQQKTAERLDRIYTMSIDLIGSANFSGYFVELNPAWEIILGHSLDELKAAPFVSFVHPDDVDLTNSEAAKLGEGALTISFVNRYRCKDGSYKWISWNAVPDMKNGQIHFVARDITNERQATQELQESRQRLQTTLEETERSQQLLNSVINATPDWIWLKDRDYRMALANTSIAKNGFASTPEDMLGKTDYELGVPDFVVDGDPERGISGWRTDDRAVLENEKTLHNPNDFVIYTDGSEHIFDTTKMPLYGPDGSVLGVLGIARNITEQRRSAQELEKSREQLRAILDNSPAVIYLKDAQGKYITINTRYEELFHIKDETTRGKTDYDIFPKEIADAIFEADQSIIKNGVAQELEELIPQDDGLHTYISTKFPLKDAEGKVYALAGISTDITERKKTEDQIRAAREEAELLVTLGSLINEAQTEQDIIDALHQHLGVPEVNSLNLSIWENGDFDNAHVVDIVAGWWSDPARDTLGMQLPAAMFPMSAFVNRHDINVYDSIVKDPRIDEVSTAALQSFGLGAFILAPLTVGERWVGLLTISTENEREHSPREVRLYRAVLDQITTAIERMRLNKQMQKRAAELETVANVGVATSSILEVDALLEAVSNLTRDSFDLYHAHIYLLDDAGEFLVLTAGAGEIGRMMRENAHSIPLDRERSLVARAARSLQGVIVNDVTQEPDFLPNPLLANTRSELAVPMIVGGQLIGVLDVQSEKVGRFNDEDVRIQTTLAGQVAVAVQNARSFAEAQEQAVETNTLYEMTSKLAQATTRPEILESVSAYPKLHGAASVSLLYVDNGADGMPLWLESTAEVRLKGTAGSTVGQRYYLPDLPFANLWISNPDSPLLIDDVMTDDRVDEVSRGLYQLTGIYGTALIPLMVNGLWVGLISVNWEEAQTFTDLDRRIYSAISQQTAAVVSSTRLFEQTQKSARELEMVAKVSAATSSILDAETLLQSVSDLTHDSFDLYHAHIYLLDDAGKNLVLAAGAGEVGRTMKANGHSISLDRENSLVARAARTRQGVTINDVTQEQGFLPNPLLPDTHSEMAVPMIVGGKLVGVLDVQSEKVGRFGEEDVRIQTTLAGQVAVAVQNALSFAETQEQAAETNTLYEISSRLAQANSRAEVLESIGGYAQSNGASSVMLLYLDTDENDNPIWADVVADLAISGTTGSSVGQRFYLPDLPFAKLWISNPNSPLLIDDITNTDRVSDPVTVGQYTANGIYGSALVPLRVNNRWVGMIVASWDKPHQFTELDQRIYSAIAQQTAAVVNSTRLFEHTEKSARELQTVTRVSAASSSILNVDELLQSVADLTRDGFNLYHAHIYLLDDMGKNLVLAAGAGETGRIMKANHHSIPASHEHSLVARAARTRRGVIANDVTKEPDFLPNPLLPDTKSELAVPMIVGGKLIGILDVQSERLDRFDNADANIKRTLADQVAVAVQNARAFEYQQEVSDRLREVDRLKSQFLANMSHELRTPLNSVIGYAEVMLDGDDGELSSEAVQDVQIIYDSGKHLLSIINDILDLAKIEAGQMHIDRREVNLVKELEEIIRAGQVLVKDKPVELRLVSDGDFEHVMADPIRMRQIVWNLVSNAIKFTEQGSVTLRLSERIAPNTANDKEVCVHVNDTGMGIEPENLEMVFERFQQADGSSTRRAGGTGLGLTITRHLVQLHGGEIYAESEIGAGSSFWFTLPANVN